jgi:hypothetical protein
MGGGDATSVHDEWYKNNNSAGACSAKGRKPCSPSEARIAKPV